MYFLKPKVSDKLFLSLLDFSYLVTFLNRKLKIAISLYLCTRIKLTDGIRHHSTAPNS